MEKGKQRPKDIKLAYRIAYLLAGYIKHTLTDAERMELEAWRNESDHNGALFTELTNEKNIQQSLDEFNKPDTEGYLEKSKEQLNFRRKKKVITIWSYVAAACVAGLIIGLIYFNPFTTKGTLPEIAEQKNEKDIQPGNSSATLTLANGKHIVLGKRQTDTLINGATIHGKQGELTYAAANTFVEYHTLTVPRKGMYKLILPDGSRVWLNAESSIQYPTAFMGNERKVVVTGETYFEIAPDKQKPFRVVTDQFVVEAVGTAFNVNAYANEPTAATTLVEGAVKLTIDRSTAILKPGQQLQMTNHAVKIVPIDIQPVVAWKNDQFHFSNTPLDAILRQLARWYDAKIVYEENVSVDLNATIDRNVPLSKLLYLLSKTDEVHFKIDGDKIIVTR